MPDKHDHRQRTERVSNWQLKTERLFPENRRCQNIAMSCFFKNFYITFTERWLMIS